MQDFISIMLTTRLARARVHRNGKKIDGPRKQLAETEEFLEAGKEKECNPQHVLMKEHIGKVLEGLSRKHAEEKNECKSIKTTCLIVDW